MQPYQRTEAYRRSHKVDPMTGAPVFPLRIVERHLSTPAPSQTPRDAGSPDLKGAAVGAAAPEGNM